MAHTNFKSTYEKISRSTESFSLPLPILQKNCFKKLGNMLTWCHRIQHFFKTLNMTQNLWKANTISPTHLQMSRLCGHLKLAHTDLFGTSYVKNTSSERGQITLFLTLNLFPLGQHELPTISGLAPCQCVHRARAVTTTYESTLPQTQILHSSQYLHHLFVFVLTLKQVLRFNVIGEQKPRLTKVIFICSF